MIHAFIKFFSLHLSSPSMIWFVCNRSSVVIMLMECFISHVAAELLKLEDYIPPYATVSDYRILQGANFASGSSGIRDETGRHYVRYTLSTLRNTIQVASVRNRWEYLVFSCMGRAIWLPWKNSWKITRLQSRG